MFGSMTMGVPRGGNTLLGVFGLIFTAALIAATIIAILMLVDAARAKGIEVKGGKLAGFWIVGLVLTPITLGLYVLCLKPVETTAPAFAQEPMAGGFAPQEPRGPFAPQEPMTGGTAFVAEAETVVSEPNGALPTEALSAGATTADGAQA